MGAWGLGEPSINSDRRCVFDHAANDESESPNENDGDGSPSGISDIPNIRMISDIAKLSDMDTPTRLICLSDPKSMLVLNIENDRLEVYYDNTEWYVSKSDVYPGSNTSE